MTGFEHFVAIDWSGAKGALQSGIAVAICATGVAAPVLIRPGHRWSRAELLEWLLVELPPASLTGIDSSPALPFLDHGAYFPGWSLTPPDARALWAFVDWLCADDPHFASCSLIDHAEASRYFRRHGGRAGDRFGGGAGRFRHVEHAQREQGLLPYSCFNLVGAAQVGKSSLTTMRLLHQLAGRLPFWPFDPRPDSGSLLVEIYTTIAAREAGARKGTSKLRNGAALDRALAALCSRPHEPLPSYTDHATDAILTAAWLRRAAGRRGLWNPPALTPQIAATEGWTFGVA